MDEFWSVAAVQPGVKMQGRRRELPFGSQMILEPAAHAAAREGLQDAGFSVFSPAVVEQRWRVRHGKREKGDLAAYALFPGYVFFGWSGGDGWSAAPHARGISDVLRIGDRFSAPARVARWKMQMLMAAGELVGGEQAPQCAASVFDVGDRVEIGEDHEIFAGMMAKILALRGKRRMRAFLELEALGPTQAFNLEVDVAMLDRKP